jgi:replication-associated recombination protein RarA
VSALQKSVRRGQEELALFWMDEMIDSGYINYFWRRMSVIVVEDIGLANPFAVTVISSLYTLNEKFIMNQYITFE